MKTGLISALFLLCALTTAMAGKPGWSVNYKKSLEKAAADEKLVLLDFTGSDWCGWCIKIDEEIFSKKAFKTLAEESLVLVELDFPQDIVLPESVVKQNEKLGEKYGVDGYPTIILVDAEGEELKRWGGYNENMLEELKEAIAENE